MGRIPADSPVPSATPTPRETTSVAEPTASQSVIARMLDPKRIGAGNRKLLITFLILCGMTLAGLAVGWLVWDLGGDVLYAAGLTGLIGFGTNWLAIRMLFHPRKRLFGFQGVIPRKRKDLARTAALLMEERLISGHRLRQWLEERGGVRRAVEHLGGALPGLLSDEVLRKLLRDAGTEFVNRSLPELREKIGAAVGETVREKVPAFMAGGVSGMIQPLLDDAAARIGDHLKSPENMDRMAAQMVPRLRDALNGLTTGPDSRGNLEQAALAAIEHLFADLKVADLIEQELLRQTDAEIEKMANDAASEQLVFIQIAGGVLGALGGLALVWPILLLVYAVPTALFLLLVRRFE